MTESPKHAPTAASDPRNQAVAPAVSITMAAFNVALYVEASIRSVLAQDCQDFELIIVDDASTDGTREILQQFAGGDPRIRLFLMDRNEGLAVARNLGIAAARGEWVTFLDADDIYSSEMLSLSLGAGRTQGAGMVIWDYVVFESEEELIAKRSQPSMLARIDQTDRHALLDLPAFAWTRMVRRDMLERLAIAFPPGLTYQDVPVHWRLITQTERIAFVPRRLAFYRQQPQATTAGKGIRRADYFNVLDQVEEYLLASGLFETYADTLTAQQLNAWYGVYDVVASEYKTRVRAMIAERLTDRHRVYFMSAKPLRWQVRAYFRSLEGDHLAALRLWLRVAARSCYRYMKWRG